MLVVDPRGMTVENWTALSAFYLAPYGTLPKLTDPDLWRDWAAVVINFPAIAGLNPPNPAGFDDWIDWAPRFNQAAKLLVT